MADLQSQAPLKRTPLYELHSALSARMVPFAGYEMPVQYAAGIMAEHTHTRAAAGLFDVSHMGLAWLKGEDDAAIAKALETLVPGDIAGLKPGQIRYTQLLNDEGGVIDDLMVSRSQLDEMRGRLFLVVNAARKEVDFAYLRARLAGRAALSELTDWALIALQGPKAEDVLERHAPGVSQLAFMTGGKFLFGGENGCPVYISRCGYTGEDGFEITVRETQGRALAESLLAHEAVMPVGLGARDSLRLEAGLCLSGHELDETVSPVEAGLTWSIGKRRRREGGFAGADRVLGEMENGPSRKLVGLRPQGRALAREGTVIADAGGREIGIVTSGGFGPSLSGPVALGFVPPENSKPGTSLSLLVRGKQVAAEVTSLPFVTHGYKKH